ncbi:ras-associating and dilute domain-containing protein isoform X10 [Mesoplodon densirostris]|uniref:ras-associating and dilute domain-containing protein isoform X10 n=1 Tax=Mesoplodon densirostris TaxID=48708 RepID=UPI0028DC21B9|nr:ras-associating and dilute domain-containing protein isoform X10 [Mesoplodon densirostris]
MFYGTHFIMSPPAKSKLKRQGQLLSSVLSRTLSYKYRDLDATCSSLGTSDDPAELSTQLSAPGVLKVFGDSVCTGTHYKSVLATGTSSARELVKEALERYALSPERAGQYVLCDVVGQAGDSGRQWQAEGFRVFGDNEKPLLIQELWKPREGLSRRFELRKRSEVEELAARDVDTVTAGSKESLFSCTLTASEESMAVLEEVVLYAFQQCVYYVSKSLYVCLPALLECPPFQLECRESWSSAPRLPEELHRVVSIYQATLDLLRPLQVHPEIAAQVLAYLFFFSGTLLFNQLLDKGPSLSCFHWPRGVQACARLQQLLEWTRSAGFGEAGERFFRKLSCTLNLLATPSAQLVQQMSWANLRAAFPALSPAQLHRLLTQYQLASAMGPMSAWEPGAQDSPAAFKSEEVLESYENPPPIVLPSEGFQVDLEADCLDDSLHQHLLYIRHFLWSLRSKPSPSSRPAQPECLQGPHHTSPEGHPEDQSRPLASRDPGRGAREAGPEHPPPSAGDPQAQGPLGRPPGRVSRRGPQAGDPHGDPSCLLTPPGTPLSLEPAVPDWPEASSACGEVLLEGRRNGPSGPRCAAPEGDCVAPAAEPPPAPSSHSSSTDDFCYMFVVELERGPSGLGMGLIDGMHTPLGAPGLYIQTLLPGSPAASDGRLSLGDRILESRGSDPTRRKEGAVSGCQVRRGNGQEDPLPHAPSLGAVQGRPEHLHLWLPDEESGAQWDCHFLHQSASAVNAVRTTRQNPTSGSSHPRPPSARLQWAPGPGECALLTRHPPGRGPACVLTASEALAALPLRLTRLGQPGPTGFELASLDWTLSHYRSLPCRDHGKGTFLERPWLRVKPGKKYPQIRILKLVRRHV